MRKKKIAVIASKEQDFKNFLRFIENSDHDEFVLINRIDKTKGRFFSHVVRIGEYWNLPDIEDIYLSALSRIKEDRS